MPGTVTDLLESARKAAANQAAARDAAHQAAIQAGNVIAAKVPEPTGNEGNTPAPSGP